jgi:hypothetical protein
MIYPRHYTVMDLMKRLSKTRRTCMKKKQIEGLVKKLKKAGEYDTKAEGIYLEVIDELKETAESDTDVE